MAPRVNEQLVSVAGRRLKVSNLDKVLYPATGTTKAEVLAYYAAVAPVLLPQVAWRPVTRKRWVEGVGTAAKPGPAFFRKDLEGSAPEWVPRVPIQHSDHVNVYPLANNPAVLAWFAQLAALELHTPQWRVDPTGRRQNPDRMVLDLDPGEGVGLQECAEVARLLRGVLLDMGMDPVPVTSGSKGIHLYAALPGTSDSEQVSAVAKELATAMEADHPDLVVSLQRKTLRAGKVLIDWSQNSGSKTTIAPYSLRGRLRPTVAAPRTWEELGSADLAHLGHEEVLQRVAGGLDPIAAMGWSGPLEMGSLDRLATYRSMRDARRTPEPVPEATPVARAGADPAFVIQEHHARRLHWDFRLERDGVLVSWAVPKGPPLDAGTNHLAVHVEDHPLEYGSFEGSIPAGEYGAGDVSIWDAGTYTTEKWRDGEEIIAVLRGRPDGGLGGLPRRFALIRAHGMGEEDNWLIHFMKEQPAPDGDGDGAGAARPTAPALAAARRPARVVAPAPRHHIDLAGLPRPMLATPGSQAAFGATAAEWAFEGKWDGVRAILAVRDGELALVSRTGKDMTGQYPELQETVGLLVADAAVLDGEIVMFDDAGRPSFERLQSRMNAGAKEALRLAGRSRVTLLVFDVLRLTVDGEERGLMNAPYSQRRGLLASVVREGEQVRVPPPIAAGDVAEALAVSRDAGWEGVVAKRLDSRYLPGRRSRSWVKLKNALTQEVVVIGWRRSAEGGRAGGIASLLLAVNDGGALRYAGRVGSGFSEAQLRDAAARLAPLQRATSPIAGVPAAERRDAVWVEPELVGEVVHAERTAAGKLRQPVWRGWRPDKASAEVGWES